MTGKTTSSRCPPPLPSSRTSAASVGSAVIITRCPPFNTSGSIFCAPLPTSQCPSFVIPIGTASYLSGSIPRITEAADASETSCSPDRPPNSTPTRNRFLSVFTLIIFPEKTAGLKRVSSGCFQNSSKNLLPQARQHQFHAQQSCPVVLIYYRIDFHNLQRDHRLR